MAVDTPAPAEGDFERTPFAQLLVYAIDHRATGALFLTEPSGVEHVVRFEGGAPVKVRPSDGYSLLGQMLVDAGAISESTLSEALATTGLLGDILLLTDSVEGEELERLAKVQFIRRMLRLFGLPPATTYRYRDGDAALVDCGPGSASVDPLALLWAGLRAHGAPSGSFFSALLADVTTPMRLHTRATTARLALNEAETVVIDRMRAGALSRTDLDALALLPEDTVAALVVALTVTRQIDRGTGATPIGAVASDTGRSRAAVARMNLRSRSHRVGAAAPDLPGDGERGTFSLIPPRELFAPTDERVSMSPSAMSASGDASTFPPRESAPPGAFSAPISEPAKSSPTMALVSSSPSSAPAASGRRSSPPSEQGRTSAPPAPSGRWSPVPSEGAGAISSPEPSGHRWAPQTETHAPISSPAESGSRSSAPAAEASRSAKAPPPPAEDRLSPATLLSAPGLHQLAVSRLYDGDVEGALDACEMALHAAPDEPDYIALSAWARAQLPGAHLWPLVCRLSEVLQAQPDHVQARYYRALLRKRRDDHEGAARDLMRVLELAPAHADASVELDVLRTRQRIERLKVFSRLFRR